MPAQPPFLTPTRTPTMGLSALAMMSLTRVAAASVRLTTLKLGRAMSLSGGRVQGPGRTRGSCLLDKGSGRRGRGGWRFDGPAGPRYGGRSLEQAMAETASPLMTPEEF